MNLTINEDLLDAGVVAVNIRKFDPGSGVKNVDIYKVMPGTHTHPTAMQFSVSYSGGPHSKGSA